ncbi:vesicle coat component [Boothiomyces macroporosus]|uniref:COPII coat assembly protein SEC16 n=1 Tax=Boothiomyces macroporosus TaxID=261099 RepID=A0AAD5Y877_9FUNG|nr:vesicle coat component [Boothiomyces macroporosus]
MSSNLKGKDYLTSGKFQFSGIPPRKKRSEANLDIKKSLEQGDTSKPPIQERETHASQKPDNGWGFDDEIDWDEVKTTKKASPAITKPDTVKTLNSNAAIPISNNQSQSPKKVDNIVAQSIPGLASDGNKPIRTAHIPDSNIHTKPVSPLKVTSSPAAVSQVNISTKSPKTKIGQVDAGNLGGWLTGENIVFEQTKTTITKNNQKDVEPPKSVSSVKASPGTRTDSSWEKDQGWGDWNSDSMEIPPVVDIPKDMQKVTTPKSATISRLSPSKSPNVSKVIASKSPKSPGLSYSSPKKETTSTVGQTETKITPQESIQNTESWDIGDEDLFSQSSPKNSENVETKTLKSPLKAVRSPPSKMANYNIKSYSQKEIESTNVHTEFKPRATEQKSPSVRSTASRKSPTQRSSPQAKNLLVSNQPATSLNADDQNQMMLTSAPGFLHTQPEISPPKSANSFHTSPVIPSKSPEVPLRKDLNNFEEQPANLQYHSTAQNVYNQDTNIYQQPNYPDHHNYLPQLYSHGANNDAHINSMEASNFAPDVPPTVQHKPDSIEEQPAQNEYHIQPDYHNYNYEQSHQLNEPDFGGMQNNATYDSYDSNYQASYGEQNVGIGLQPNVHVDQSVAPNISNYDIDQNNQLYMPEQTQSEHIASQGEQQYYNYQQPQDINGTNNQDAHQEYYQNEGAQQYQSYPESTQSGFQQTNTGNEYPIEYAGAHYNDRSNQLQSDEQPSGEVDYSVQATHGNEYIPTENTEFNYADGQQYQQQYYDPNGGYAYDDNSIVPNYDQNGPIDHQAQQQFIEHDNQIPNNKVAPQPTDNLYIYDQGAYTNQEILDVRAHENPTEQISQGIYADSNVDSYAQESSNSYGQGYPEDDFGLHSNQHLQNSSVAIQNYPAHTESVPLESSQQVSMQPADQIQKDAGNVDSENQENVAIDAAVDSSEVLNHPYTQELRDSENNQVNYGQPLGHSFQSTDTLASRQESVQADSVSVTYIACHSCNKNNDSDANFCAKCGTKLITKDSLFRDRGYGFGRITDFGKIFTTKVLRESREKALPGNLLWHHLAGLVTSEHAALDIFATDGPIFDYAQVNLESLAQNISTYIGTLQEEDSYLLTYYLLLMLQYNDTEQITSESIKYFVSVLTPQDFQQISPIDQILYNLLGGFTNEAIELALNFKIWEVALIMAKYFESDLYGKVVLSMMKQGIGKLEHHQYEATCSNSVMELLLAIMAGVNQTDARELLMMQNEKFVPNWKLYLAALLSIRRDNNPVYFEVIGEILTETGLPKVGHLCELIAFSFNLKNGLERFKSKVLLLGADHISNPYTYHNDFAAIQLTELLEAHVILNGQWQTTPFTSLQHHKLKLAAYLGDLGYNERANRYFESIQSFTQYLSPDPGEDTHQFQQSLGEIKALYQKTDTNDVGAVGIVETEMYSEYGYSEVKVVENVAGDITEFSIDQRRQSEFTSLHGNEAYQADPTHDGIAYHDNQQFYATQEYEYSSESLPIVPGNDSNTNFTMENINEGIYEGIYETEKFTSYTNEQQPNYGIAENLVPENTEVYAPPPANQELHQYSEQLYESKPPLPPLTPNIPKSTVSPPVSQDTKVSPPDIPPPPIKPSIHEDEEDLGFGNSKPKAKETPKTGEKDEPKEEPKEEPKKEVYKAHLPTGNPIVYDPVTKKWVKKDQLGKVETKEEAPPPPPPIVPSAPSSDAGGPPPAKFSESPISTPTGATPPISRSSTKKRGARSKYVDIINPNSAESSPIVQSFVPQFDSPLGEPRILSPKTGPKMMDIAKFTSVSNDQSNQPEGFVPSTRQTVNASVPIGNVAPSQKPSYIPPAQSPLSPNRNAPPLHPTPGVTTGARATHSRPPSANLQGRPGSNLAQRIPTRPQNQYPPDSNAQNILSRPSSTNSLGFDKPGRQGAPPADL